MARRSLDNLLKFARCKWKVRCQLHPDGYIGTDKSDSGLTIVVIPFQKINNHIQSSSDESEELFFAHPSSPGHPGHSGGVMVTTLRMRTYLVTGVAEQNLFNLKIV
jgi:hypothetical protein